MKKYDHIVVGGGISGLTLAQLLASNGKKVLLVEKAPHIGGSLVRFYKKDIPFDTGFHFTAGFSKGGILTDMLQVLGMREQIKPIFISGPGSGLFVFEKENLIYDVSAGTENFRLSLHKYFPEETAAINEYIAKVKKVFSSTPSLDLRKIGLSSQTIDEDYLSLQQVLDSLTQDNHLKGILSAFCVCYGVGPKETSFGNHARIAGGLYESVARIENGGEAFIRAFKNRFSQSSIEVCCNTTISQCQDIKNDCVGKFVLSNGQIITADDCTFTIHPQEILKILPRQHFKKAFLDRVSAFETSYGFFCVSGVVENADPSNFGPSIASLLPSTDLNSLLSPEQKGETALAIIRCVETGRDGKKYCTVNAFGPEFYSNLKQWADSSIGKRPADYYEYKAQRAKRVTQRLYALYPQYRGNFKVLDTASVLTFRDYLFSPEGNAYGIKQKMGQFNLFGKLPLMNIYVAGQSAVLPGIVGAMVSSFIVARNLIGKEKFNHFIEGALSN
ncbi:MAG TPA: NAD(P)-binding protein [Candidatus Omnitrophota bacterium]|nr:NAD(P)-binding protein [Candidatus Omnitrophota bacterium]